MEDQVNHPSHYKRNASPLMVHVRGALLEDVDPVNMECFEAMLNLFSDVDEVRGYLRGNSFKYRWRYPNKGGIQDIRKAHWYEKRLEKLEVAVSEFFARENINAA